MSPTTAEPRTTAAAPNRSRALTVLTMAAIALVAANLRPAVPSFGALLRDVQQATGMSSPVAGILTTLPPVCFGVFGLLGGWFGRRLRPATALLVCMALVAGGLALRVATSQPWLIVAFTVPALAGMALGNVLLPVGVKRWFPTSIGRATGLYSLSMAVGTAVAAALTVPVARAGGSWRAGLGLWALTPLLAVLPLVLLRRADAPAPTAGAEVPVMAPPPASPVHRNRRAWALVGFFGMQSLAAYVVFGWLPTIFQDAGIGADMAGLLLAWVIILGAPISVVLPELAARREDQRIFVVGLTATAGAAYVGLLVAPASAPWVWATLLGVGMGTFPLALLLIGLRAATSEGTAQLSGLAQGGGYLLAAGGPFAIGALHDATSGWTWPLLVLLGLLVPQLVCGLAIAKPGLVDVPARPAGPPPPH